MRSGFGQSQRIQYGAMTHPVQLAPAGKQTAVPFQVNGNDCQKPTYDNFRRVHVARSFWKDSQVVWCDRGRGRGRGRRSECLATKVTWSLTQEEVSHWI